MKIASLVLGILGGIAGLIAATLALGVGGLGAAFDAEGASTVIGLGWSAFLFALIAIVGGAIAIAKPKVSGWMQLIACIGGLISISAFWTVSFILLLMGSIFAFVGAKQDKNIVAPNV